MHHIKITTHIFPSPIICVIGDSLEDCSKTIREYYGLNISYSDDCYAATELINGYVCLSLTSKSYLEDPSILVHESLHAAIEVLNYIRQPISNHTDELLCYLQQYIYKELKKFLDQVYDKSK